MLFSFLTPHPHGVCFFLLELAKGEQEVTGAKEVIAGKLPSSSYSLPPLL